MYVREGVGKGILYIVCIPSKSLTVEPISHEEPYVTL